MSDTRLNKYINFQAQHQKNFSMFNFIFQIMLSNYEFVGTAIKCKYLNDTNILFKLSKTARSLENIRLVEAGSQ